MMITPRQKQELYNLLNALCENTITDDEFDRLDTWLKTDKNACKIYVDFVSVWSDLQYLHASLYSQNDHNTTSMREMLSGPNSFTDSAIWKALADAEKDAPAIEITAPEEPKILIQKVQRQKIVRKISKSSLFSLFAAAAAIILIVVFARFAPPANTGFKVASLADSLNAKWADMNPPITKGMRLTTGSTVFSLREGLAELLFDNNAKVVLEAPVEFQILSYDQIKLSYGRLYATVPNEALGFVVSTPTSKVIDLGTEFGVQADFNGNMELHVTKGKTLLTAIGQNKKSILDVIAGQAGKVLAGSSRIQTIPIQDANFVRKIDSKTGFIWKGQTRLSLTDLLLGGDGYYTSTVPEMEYNPLNGQQIPPRTPQYEPGSGGYVKVMGNSCLDGIFVPNGKIKPVVVSSAGHNFESCPDTTGLLYSNILILRNWKFYEPAQSAYEKYRKDTSHTSLIYLHSNIGITFDLQKVRQALPNLKLQRFNAFVGTVQSYNNNVMGTQEYSEYDVWVLVDGQVRFCAKALRFDGSREIRIELSDQDRFLSLAVTDGQAVYFPQKPANHFDTCGFADPVFEVDVK